MDSLLDGHPNIWGFNPTTLSKTVMGAVKEAVGLAESEREDYLSDYIRECFAQNEWDSYVSGDSENAGKERFSEFRRILHGRFLQEKECSERELFLILYESLYQTFYGAYQTSVEPIIFMDVHDGSVEQEYLLWLKDMGFEVTLLEAIRNPILKLGSFFRMWKGKEIRPDNLFRQLNYLGHETLSDVEQQLPILRYRFEDLKLYPKVILGKICEQMGIPWNDVLLDATFLGKESTFRTSAGEKTKGFSLKQVWYPYEEYFNPFDKFRLDLLFRERCAAYDYSCTLPDKYPCDEKEMISWFELPFSFEKEMTFSSEEELLDYRKDFRILAEKLVSMYYEKEKYPNLFCFGEYLKVDKDE